MCVVNFLLTAAVLPLMFAHAFDRSEDEGKSQRRITIDSASPDKEIRDTLLKHTPLGTGGVDVLSFTLDKLHVTRPVNAYSAYDKAYQASTGKASSATPISAKIIAVIVSERPVRLLSSERVWAKWHFDEKDRLTDITIVRDGIGP